MKIGLMGMGNMATAIVKGVLQSQAARPDELVAFDVDLPKSQTVGKIFGIEVVSQPDALIAKSDCVILAVKPNVLPTLVPTLREGLKERNPLIISIAAGKTLSFLEELLPEGCRLVRVMPNINAVVLSSMSAYCSNSRVTGEDRQLVERLFSSVGKLLELEESYFPVFGVLAGCSPAYGYLFIDSLARAGVKNGLDKKRALEIAAQTMLGSAKMVLESGEHPQELIDRVCSPGGTTIQGLCALQEGGLESAVVKAVDAAVERDRTM